VLLTGLEAALAAERSGAFDQGYRRVRFGSSGQAAKDVQQKVGAAVDGDFRRGSVLALLRSKSEVFQDPIAIV
jgi:hypothetical protein